MQLVTATGRSYPLQVGINTIGRDMMNNIILNESSASRKHAELYWDGRQCTIRDLNSTNGTFLNGQRLAPYQSYPVPPGARLRFGTGMEATLVADSVGAPAAHEPSSSPPAAPSASSAPPSSAASPLEMIFHALDIALDYRKLGLAAGGLLAIGIVAALFGWLFSQIESENEALGTAIGLLGLLIVWVLSVILTAMVTRMIIVELRGEPPSSVSAVFYYTLQHLGTFFFSPLILFLLLFLLILGEVVLLLIGRVDYIGEMVVSLAFLPLVILNLFIFIIALFGTTLIFPIVADRGGGPGDTISSVWTLVRRAPGQMAAYTMLAVLVTLLAFGFFLYLLFTATSLTLTLVQVGMESDKLTQVLTDLPFNVTDMLDNPFSSLLWGGYSRSEPPVTYDIARFFFGLSFVALAMFVLTVPLLFSQATTCAVYLSLRQHLSDYNLGGF